MRRQPAEATPFGRCLRARCLQHENFNQDEWRIPEGIVRYLDKDIDGKISVFTGPIFTDYDRWFFQSGMVAPVRVPSAFWKLVAYIDKETNKLASQGCCNPSGVHAPRCSAIVQ